MSAADLAAFLQTADSPAFRGLIAGLAAAALCAIAPLVWALLKRL